MSIIRNFIIEEDDILMYSLDYKCPYFMETKKTLGMEHLFAANIVHTTLIILEEKYGKNKLVPTNIIHKHSHDGITLNEFYNTISNVLEVLGYDRHMPLMGKNTTTTPSTFKSNIYKYIQECCPDNKQRHIFPNGKYFNNESRTNPENKYYRPNIFSSPDSWNWFSEDNTRWFPNGQRISKRSPSFIRYFKSSEVRDIPENCKKM